MHGKTTIKIYQVILNNDYILKELVGGVWRSWLRHCVTRREVPLSIPEKVHENFQVT
jgi:hypothetical protein